MARLVLPAILGALVFAGVRPIPVALLQAAAAPKAFDELARRADEARARGRLDEAAALYREALAQRPRWPDGWWYLGTLAYEGDQPGECVAAFRRLLALKPELRPAWALRGLCAFQLREYAAARQHLTKALAAGPLADESMGRVVGYHLALLAIQVGAFEAAIQPLTQLLQAQAQTPELSDACGLVLLRRAQVPKDVPAGEQPYLRSVGAAYCAHLARRADEAQRLFAELVDQRPGERYLHYGYGLALAQAGNAESLAQFQREIDLFPDELLARVELAFGLLARGRASEALPFAERAVVLAPGLFVTHLALGRALVEAGDDVDRGLRELELAARLEPGIVEIHWALANAYARAGRDADAARERQTVRTLAARRSGREAPAPPRP